MPPTTPAKPMPMNGSTKPTPAQPTSTKRFAISKGTNSKAQKIGIYGTGGIGKSSLVESLKSYGRNPIVLDLEGSTNELDVARIEGIESWEELRACLATDEYFQGFDAVVIDTITVAQELCERSVIATIPKADGTRVKRLADYGYGKEVQILFEHFCPLFADLDRHVRAGRDVILIAHDCTSPVPNPNGDDYLNYQPRLKTSKQGDASIRSRFKEWLDHLFFLGYDVFAKDGKAQGSGSRTIYPQEMPTHWAKTRRLSDPIVYEKGSTQLWEELFGVK
jgi:hypothetical protein